MAAKARGIDNHPRVITALAVTVLEIIEKLKLAAGAAKAKEHLLRALSRGDLDYDSIHAWFDRAALDRILDSTRYRRSWLMTQKKSDQLAARIISNINKAVG